ncbi:MAG TPA: L,D-transpeptidase family protein [Allosphingosinicella sp.]|nr:L,D-transpeptidase family protein [Allosphingosinicella sp.]
MKQRFLPIALLLAATAAPAVAQLQAGEAPTPEQVQAGEAPATIVPEHERVARELEAQMAALRWTRTAAQDLFAYVMRVEDEGLDSSDYGREALSAGLAGTDDVALSTAATDTFLRLSSDLALGHVRGGGRLEWHTVDTDIDARQQYDLMQRAIANNSVWDTLNSLLPTHPQYAELKQALANAEHQATRDKIRANLDRWRWLPRDLGRRYVIVNVPAFTVALIEDGRVVARHKVVVGKPATATPQLNAVATGVIFNPWWEVPDSIADEVQGKKGYVTVKYGDKVHYRQPPGPKNALGQMKVVMPNNYAIYLHDTPSKTLFSKSVRAFSHGCIRTQNALGFAELLLGNPQWDKAAITKALASGKTVRADAISPTPVYIAYFTAAALADNKGILTYTDLYSRDTPVLAALNDKEGTPVLASSAGAATQDN